MGVLALVALATALGPMVFDVTPAGERWLTLIEWVLVSAFAAEFVVQAAVAPNRSEWIRSRWRIVDVVTILGPVVALLPQVSDLASGSLMLRALRIGRAVAFGTRAGSVVVRKPSRAGRAAHVGEPTVKVLSANGGTVSSDWNTFLRRANEPAAGWAHASGLDDARFRDFARLAGMSDRDLDRIQIHDTHARLRDYGDRTTLLLQIPSVSDGGFPEVHREWLLAVVTEGGVLSASTGAADLQNRALLLGTALQAPMFEARVISSLLSGVSDDNLAVSQRLEDEARRLEAVEGGKAFLHDSFQLRRKISSTALDLWHVRNIVHALASGKARLRDVSLKDEKALDELLAEIDSLYETVSRTKEEVQTLIELHINFKSFEMNKFLKLLAVVSFLGLIPSVVGGLLGMNVSDNPWPVTLGQVAFGVVMGMAIALYVFAVKGWLR